MILAKDKILILFSGGIDSTALIYYYKSKEYQIKCLHIQYNQESAKSELKSVKKICDYYNISFEVVSLPFSIQKRFNEYIGRNTLFVLIALSSKFSESYNRIAIGINASSHYYDCSNNFINDIQTIVDGYYAGTKAIEAPFVNLTKYEIIYFCISNEIPIDLTYSCLMQNSPPCGKCGACRDRRIIDEIDRFM